MEVGEESGIEVGWRVNEGGEEKALVGVRKEKGGGRLGRKTGDGGA